MSRRRRLPRQQEFSQPVSDGQPTFPDLATEEMVTRQKEALERLVQAADRSFQEKQAASARRDWCNPVPVERKVDTVQSFLQAFHNEDSMEMAACSVYYLQCKPRDLVSIDWRKAIPAEIQSTMAGVLECRRCFPEAEAGNGAAVPICCICRAAFDRCRVPEACMGSIMLTGCEHRYPKELRDLTPLEEKLVSLNTAYRFITKFNIRRGQQTGPTYRKHIAGHVTVFPNDVESLAATILPHPLISMLDQVHAIWSGLERPTPRDVSKLLSVRPRTLRAALRWLCLNNPHYMTLHLGPPVAVLLQSDAIADLAIPGLPQGTILIKSKMVAIPECMRGKRTRSRGKPGFEWVTHRTGPLCTPAFAMTDQKSQGKQFPEVILNLKGIRGSGTATRPSFMSLYVQLSRAERWKGLYFFSETSTRRFYRAEERARYGHEGRGPQVREVGGRDSAAL